MDLDPVDVAVHSREAGVRSAVAVAIAEHPADIRMVDLDELIAGSVPEGQPFDLHLGVVVGRGPAAILSVGSHDHGEGILVVERQRAAGQLDPHTSGHPLFLPPGTVQMGIIRRRRLCSVQGANSMCSQSRFNTLPSWLDVLSPDGLEWL